jgi:hypothetical protein
MNNLTWSPLIPKTQAKRYLENISTDTGQYVNIGHIYDPDKQRDERYSETFGIEYPLFITGKECVFCFDISMKTYNQEFIINPGKYRFRLTVGASNCKSISKTYELYFSGKWEEFDNNKGINDLIIKEIS